MAEMKEDIENLPTLYKIDLVDFATGSDDFKKEALAEIEAMTKAGLQLAQFKKALARLNEALAGGEPRLAGFGAAPSPL